MFPPSYSSSYSLGLFFIFLVAVIWSIASIVVQYLYTDQHFDSPFLLTYIGTSLFILLLISRLAYERRHKLVSICCFVGAASNDDEEDEEEKTDIIIPWKSEQTTYQHVPSSEESLASLEHVQIDVSDDKEQPSSDRTATNADASNRIWSHVQHIQVAIRIAPVWFVANWAYNGSLAYTSITSSTVLASTGSLFTFLFAVLCRDETFTLYKFLGVLLGVTGSMLTGLHDANSNSPTETINATDVAAAADDDNVNPSILCVAGPSGTRHHVHVNDDAFAGDHAIWGDILGLLSAVGYGAYAVMIRLKCPRDERLMSMQLLLGYIGLVNAIMLSPMAFYVLFQGTGHGDGTSVSIGLTWVVFGYLVAKGTLDNVLSDYLWARAVVLTSATVATVGLGLTIPLAFVSDWIMGHDNVVSVQSVLGALSVLTGFVLVNLGEDVAEQSEEDDSHPMVSANNVESSTSPGLVTSSGSETLSSASSSKIAAECSNEAR